MKSPVTPLCAPSISKRLARTLALLVLAGMGVASAVIFSATAMSLRDAQADLLRTKTETVSRLIAVACTYGEQGLLQRLTQFEPIRSGTHISLTRADASPLYSDPGTERFRFSRSASFVVPAPAMPGGEVRGELEIDTTHDTRMLKALALTLLLATLGCAGLTGMGIRWLVQRDLRPLRELAAQTRAISADRLDQRLQLECPAEELQPWLQQFNALMGRLEKAYAQLEGFNADVAHELRTPLASLIGQTEVALSRERPPHELRETLASNLEEMQRLSSLVNDMLFLSRADRGASARRGEPLSLAELAQEVLEFHEAPLEEAGLKVRVQGDAQLPVDAPLVRRALSNLLGNATRFATAGSTVTVELRAEPDTGGARLLVHNLGPGIEAAALPRLFDRFFRCDLARSHGPDQLHHGLGLAIVAAIARMHGGQPLAESADGQTRIGFTLAAA